MFAAQDQDDRRAGVRGLTRNHHGALARRLRRAAVGAVCAASVALPLAGAAAAQAATTATAATMTTAATKATATTKAVATLTPLNLVNGWTNYGLYAAVTNINGIVHLRGEITTKGTNPVAFTLPAGDRPAARVYVPVDMCGNTNGRLDIKPTGVATVEAEGSDWANASCFTSLDGGSFAASASSFTPLTPENGWTSYGSGTASPAARNISGIVYLRGAIKTPGTNPAALTLPAGDRPATEVFVAADMCKATNGRLDIAPNGTVTVETPAGSWANASCFTSLDGVSFATSANSFTPLTLENGWTSYGSGMAAPAVRNTSGIVHLEGAIQTNGTNGGAFTLPPGDRPSAYFTVKADLCGANNGSLFIEPSGVVVVETPAGGWPNAQCLTSLDGVSFAR